MTVNTSPAWSQGFWVSYGRIAEGYDIECIIGFQNSANPTQSLSAIQGLAINENLPEARRLELVTPALILRKMYISMRW